MFLIFAKPIFLLVGLLVVAITLLFFLYTEKLAWKRLSSFAENALLGRLTKSHSRRRLWVKNSLLMSAVFLLFVSLARPQWGANWEEAETRGIDIMIALDTSRSMLAEDISPNRLERSKLAILDLLNSLQGDRIGLIAFAGNAFLQCPLTLDYQAFRQTLAAIDTNSIPVGGTDVAAAIDEANAYFEASGNEKILILITDGEDLEASGILKARESSKEGMRILTVGVGSTKGELIPVRNALGETEYLRDASGKPVSTSLDEQTLKKIAEVSQGLYTPLGSSGSGLDEVYQYCLAQLPAESRQESLQRIPIERFQWVLLIAIFILIIESLISTRQRMRNSGNTLVALLTVAIVSQFPNTTDGSTLSEASKAFKDERYEESATLYKEAVIADPNNAKIVYNLGVSNYRSGRFADSIANFETSLRLAKPSLQEKSFHNMGNSRVALGFNLLEEDPQQTKDQWNAAIIDYENALDLDGNRSSTQQNLQLIKDTIEAHTYTLTTIATPEEGGTVTDGTRIFHNITYEVKATPAEGYIFSEWTGDGLEDPTKQATVVKLTTDTTITANFIKTWDLTVLSENESMGTAEKSGTYREDEPVKIKATAVDYFAFHKWKSDEVEFPDPKQAETEINLTSDATVTASFVPAFKLSVELDPEIAGQAGPSGFFEQYSSVPIKAQPRPGFEWIEWIGDGIEELEEEETSIYLSEDRIAIAKMKRIWNLVIVPTPEEGGTVEGAGNHPIGTTVDIAATANEGFTFSGWEGPGVEDPTQAQTKVTVQSREHTLFAQFTQDDQDNQDDQNQDQEQDQQDQEQSEEENQDSEQDEQEQQEQEQEEQQSDPSEGDQQEQEPQPQEMTREQARQLLNALSESEKFLPAGELSEEKINAETPTGRDW